MNKQNLEKDALNSDLNFENSKIHKKGKKQVQIDLLTRETLLAFFSNGFVSTYNDIS